MKKYYFALAAMLLCLLSACRQGGEEAPELKSYQGDWYMVRDIYDVNISVSNPFTKKNWDIPYAIDTTLTDSLVCFTLAADQQLLIDGTPYGTYDYDELEGTLTVHSDSIGQWLLSAVMQDNAKLVEELNGIYDITKLLPDLSTMVMTANFTSTDAKVSYATSKQDYLANVFPYSYSISLQSYFKRQTEK